MTLRRFSWRALPGLAVVGAVLAGCGSTVPQVSQVSLQDGRVPGEVALEPRPAPTAAGTTSPSLAGGPASVACPRSQTGHTGPCTRASAVPSGRATAEVTDRGPLRIGFLAFLSAAQSLGGDNGQSFTARKAEEALVAELNRRGGIAGRRIFPTYVEVRGNSSDYASDLQAACATFTDDARVAVVLGTLGLFDESFESCLHRAGVPHVPGDVITGDSTVFASFPGLITPVAMELDRRLRTQLRELSAAGVVGKDDTIGLFMESCPVNERVLVRTIRPEAARLGLKPVVTQKFPCFRGIGDVGDAASAASSAVLRFQSEGVDAVLVLGQDPQAIVMLEQAANAQRYHPTYLISSADYPEVIRSSFASEDLARTVGIGWVPSTDVGRPTDSSAGATCTRLLARQGISPTSPLDKLVAREVCDSVFSYEALLRSAAGDTRLAAIAGAAPRISYVGAAPLDGLVDFRSRRDGPAAVRLVRYSADCGCFAYDGTRRVT